MVVEKSGENEEPEEPEEAPENKKKTKRRKLSERLQDPIRVKDRSKQVKVNSFRTQTLTLKKKSIKNAEGSWDRARLCDTYQK